MNVLFVHNNFPAQFGHVVRALSQDKQTKVVAIGSATAREMPNVKLLKYYLTDADVAATHPFARRFDLECRRAEQVLYAASSLASSEFIPDVIVAHPGWGESLPLRAIFPKAYLLAYCEFFYAASDRDVGFDPEFAEIGIDGHVTLHLKNAATLLTLADCDLGYSPTAWQRSTFPHEYRDKIRIIHEGVDIELAKPEPGASFQLTSGHELTPSDEVVTFVARNFEPLRGYHIFMRALPRILAKRPRAQVLIIGGDGAPYGMVPPEGQTWKSIFFNEVASRIDQRRVHFTGYLQHADYIRALQISSAHVYLTYPFVLSWSVVEALSVGCVVIASDTAPVREIINPEENGILVPFFDVSQLADRVIEVLAHPGRFRAVRENARRAVEEKYDMRNCVSKLMKILTTRPAASPTSKNRRRLA
jgi:glycosyltransferase involved in cell wall biosynthesis